MALQNLQNHAQDAQLHVCLAGVLEQSLQSHHEHVLGCPPILPCLKGGAGISRGSCLAVCGRGAWRDLYAPAANCGLGEPGLLSYDLLRC